jgi:hypothetical protein
MLKSMKLFCLVLFVPGLLLAQQNSSWQQRVDYKMVVDMDVSTHQFSGNQTLTYFNNSPDTLDKVFYHLYFNAFQPNSMMDVRSRTIKDPDGRVGSRIFELKPGEVGFHRVQKLTQDGKPLRYEEVGTILEVALNKPLLPGESSVFYMEFDSQVPLQIRRSGRDNKEGVAYSMAQWYPKMCEYDYQGWHANPYIAREFHGVWGDFDVEISIDRDYVIGGTGYLQNPEEIGYGYETEGMKVKRPKGKKLKWHFVAPNVHDFVWAADPDYTHTTYTREDGITLHFFFQKNDKTEENWADLPPIMDKAMTYINETFGEYPYKQYSFIQGGDGGMEYPMATLITGERQLGSLVGVSVHELIHSWYQMVLASNESLYSWMDEGFTSYGTAMTMNYLRGLKLFASGPLQRNPQSGSYAGYMALINSGLEEPMTTHADHYTTNFAYGRAAYSKGAVFLHQLETVIGQETLRRGLLRYFQEWKYKHPNPNDFIRVMEKVSGLELDWYKEYMVNTTKFVDYGIKEVEAADDGKTVVFFERIGEMPMPLDVVVSKKDGSSVHYHIPLRIMRGAKGAEFEDMEYVVLEDWPWTHPKYEVELSIEREEILSIEIDPFQRMADTNPDNDIYQSKDR